MTLVELAEKLRPYIEKAVQFLSDEDALEATSLYPKWKPEMYCEASKRYCYDNNIYTCLSSHTSQSDWTPKDAPSLFAKVLIENPNVIPEWEQPNSTNPYMAGDKVKHNDKTWISNIDNNVWEPGVYGWSEV